MTAKYAEYWNEVISRIFDELDSIEERVRKQEILCEGTRKVLNLKFTLVGIFAMSMGGLLGWIIRGLL